MKIHPIGIALSAQDSNVASRVLAEPNSVSDWGKESFVSTKSKTEVWEGQFGTRRYIHRDEQGLIDGALLVGRRNPKENWQELLVHTRKDKRRQGIATFLHDAAVQDNGELLDAAEYSPDGQSFKASTKFAQTIYRGDANQVSLQDFDIEYGMKQLNKDLGSSASMGPGIYFASHEDVARMYGSNVTRKVLNNAKLISLESPKFSTSQIDKMLKGISKEKLDIAVSNWDENFYTGRRMLLNTVVQGDSAVDQLMNIWAEVFLHQNPNEFIDLMVKNNIDGITIPKNDVVFFVIYNRNVLAD